MMLMSCLLAEKQAGLQILFNDKVYNKLKKNSEIISLMFEITIHNYECLLSYFEFFKCCTFKFFNNVKGTVLQL
jgi:hypothetical protein